MTKPESAHAVARRRLALPALAACGLLALLAADAGGQGPLPAGWLHPYRGQAEALVRAATADDFAWRRLADLTDTFGHRLSGSENLARAVAWAAETMKRDGLENVHTEPVMVPRWVRGYESAEILDPPRHSIAVLGLGGTVPTPPSGVEGEVLVVSTFEELRARAGDARGRIVLFNAPFVSYAETVRYRTGGARAAARVGASAALVRSVGPMGLRTPHTGSIEYGEDVAKIPSAAVSAEDANRIARLTEGGRPVRIRLTLESRFDPDVPSANVVAEIRGRERPDEIVLLGGHLDSWDVGTGASDDGAGCIVTWEALRLLKQFGIRPRRTVRLVLFTNEENGLRGAAAYAERYEREAGDHVFAIESDSGVFAPATLGFSGSPAARAIIRDIGMLLASVGLSEIATGGGGPDIGPISLTANTPMLAYLGDPARLFKVHHSAADTVERIAPEELSRAAAAMAVMSYVVADMPTRLPR